MLGAAILIPVSAYIVRLYDSDALAVGLLSLVYSAAQFVAAPMLGALSDRYGRRPVLLVSVLGSAIGYYTFGLGGTLWVLFVARLVDGITGGSISTAQAYIADISSPQQRAKNFALVGATSSLGFILGPAIGGALGQTNVTLPAFGAGRFSLLAAIFGYLLLPESLPNNMRVTGPVQFSKMNPLAAVTDMARRANLGILLVAVFVFNLVYGAMGSNFSVYTIEKFAFTPLANAAVFTLVGLVGGLTQAGLVRRLIPRFGEKSLVLGGLALQISGFLGVTFAQACWILYPACALIGIGNGFMRPTLTALIANSVSFHEQGKVAGVTTSVTGLAYLFGPLWAGVTYDYVMRSAPYWTGAVLLALTFWLVLHIGPIMSTEKGKDIRIA